MRWKLEGTKVVGGTCTLDGGIPFARARVVLRRQDSNDGVVEQYLLVNRYPSPEHAEGNPMTADQWAALIASGEADKLSEPFDAAHKGTLWLLGRDFPKKPQVLDHLRMSGALIDDSTDAASGVVVCYVNADSAERIRQGLAEKAFLDAMLRGAARQWNEAVALAERGFAIGGMTPGRIALLAVLYERQGRTQRSEGYLQMALNSRGQQFYEETLSRYKDLSGDFPDVSIDEEDFAADVDAQPGSFLLGHYPQPLPIDQLSEEEYNKALRKMHDGKSSVALLQEALLHAETAASVDSSPKNVALVMHLSERVPGSGRGRAASAIARHYYDDPESSKKLNEQYRDLTTVSEKPRTRQSALLIGVIAVGLLTLVLVLGKWATPSLEEFKITQSDHAAGGMDNLLRKLSATILVYFMQFGFITFEAGYVQESYRRTSAVKNLIVFAISFLSYFLLGWHIQQYLHHDELHKFHNLIDIAFNAGFASTVSLIIANTITERGTLLVNALLSVAAAGVAYPLLAGLLFPGGRWATEWGFQDTAGGCVVHVLGGALGFTAACWIGPRWKRRAWHLLGRVPEPGKKHQLPFSVIGAFFLWFGWLGFNSGNAETWDTFQLAFTNTNIGASAGGLVGLMIAVANIARLTTTARIDLSSRNTVQEMFLEIANIERVVLGMMGGLVAVTANASIVQPHEALIEAILGAGITIVGSAYLAQTKMRILRRVDDPLGAIATHGMAGVVGILATAAFGYGTWWAQLKGCGMAIFIGALFSTIVCGILLAVERRRSDTASFLYGRLFRLTPYEQSTGGTGTEFLVRAEAIERARARISTHGPRLQTGGRDQEWIVAVGVLALSDKPDEELEELFAAVDRLLETSYEGGPEEEAAIAAIKARANVERLRMCVTRARTHRSQRPDLGVVKWGDLDRAKGRHYRETLIITCFELAESFAAQYRVLRVVKTPTEIRQMIEGFAEAFYLLKDIGEEIDGDRRLWKRARRICVYMKRLPWYAEIMEEYQRITPPPITHTAAPTATADAATGELRQPVGGGD